MDIDVTYRSPPCQVCCDVRPFSLPSRLILTAAADTPMKTAKIGSAIREMMYVGAAAMMKTVCRPIAAPNPSSG